MRRLSAIRRRFPLRSAINPNLLALDADGVLLDYHAAYAKAWAKAFGGPVSVIDPLAYWPKDRYGLAHLTGKELAHFRTQFDHEFWESIPAIPGAIEAASSLRAAGYDLICLTAIRPEHHGARVANLKNLGFPIDQVVSAHGDASERSPKADALLEWMPGAFVDDFLPYMRGAHEAIHTALIDRSPNGSPNRGDELRLARSTHADLKDFSRFWLSREHP